MAYATVDTLIKRFGADVLIDLTDRSDTPTGQIDRDAVEEALKGAQALIDGYIGGRYALPVSEPVPLLTDTAEAITYYKLHLYEVTDKVKNDYRDAIKRLERISEGKLRLDIAGREAPRTDAGEVRTTDRARPFNPSDMSGFI